MEAWDSSRIPRTVVRQGSPTVKLVEACLTLSCRCIYVIVFGPKGRFVMNKYLYYWTWNLVIILLLYVWFEHPRHTYGAFVPSFSERGMTHGVSNRIMFDIGTQFILKFWERLHETMDIRKNFDFFLSPSDRWTNWESKLNSRGYAESLCSIVREELG
jgi:hypothetical protein